MLVWPWDYGEREKVLFKRMQSGSRFIAVRIAEDSTERAASPGSYMNTGALR